MSAQAVPNEHEIVKLFGMLYLVDYFSRVKNSKIEQYFHEVRFDACLIVRYLAWKNNQAVFSKLHSHRAIDRKADSSKLSFFNQQSLIDPVTAALVNGLQIVMITRANRTIFDRINGQAGFGQIDSKGLTVFVHHFFEPEIKGKKLARRLTPSEIDEQSKRNLKLTEHDSQGSKYELRFEAERKALGCFDRLSYIPQGQQL